MPNSDKATMGARLNTVVIFYKAFVGFCIYLVYRLCRLCADACNIIISKFIDENLQPTGSSAQHGRIIWKQKHFELDEPSLLDFLCVFSSRVEPDYVLRRNVSLYAITTKEAIFVETTKIVDIYNSNVHPFCFIAQFMFARSVIKMSITQLVALAERIGDPTVPVILVSNTGRCGGTMLVQMFESVPGTLAINEQHPPFNLCNLQKIGAIHDSQYDAILKSIIRVLCKPRQGIVRICIKPHPVCTIMMKDIARLMPQIKQLFIYRNCLNTNASWVGTLQSEPFLAVMKICADTDWFSKLFPYFRYIERYYFISKPAHFEEIPDSANTSCMFAYMWSYFILSARNAMSCDPSILSVKYEHIIATPKEAVRELFKSFDIDAIHLDDAVASMERDSQRDSVLSRDRLASSKYISTEDQNRINSILAKFSLPSLDKDFTI